MDKKLLLSKSLASFVRNYLQSLNDIVHRYPKASIQFKHDGSPVTELDLFLSSHVEAMFRDHYPDINFYSEENYSEWKFPLLALDPLDGTKEYIEGRNEWAISLGLFGNENFEGEGWVYNPKTGEIFEEPVQKFAFKEKPFYRGEVSRSEWDKGLFQSTYEEQFQIEPVGSIAYKLGRLSHQKCDFVVSLRPKNIWDIAGGTLLCQKAGLKFYSQGQEVKSVSQLYRPPLIWCHEELYSSLSKFFP